MDKSETPAPTIPSSLPNSNATETVNQVTSISSTTTPARPTKTAFKQNQTSQWLTVDSPSRQGPIVHRIQPPGRSISTFVYHQNIVPQKVNAAPFPSLPSKSEIQEQKNAIDSQVLRYRAELSALQHQRNFYDHSSNSLVPTLSRNGVKEYHNLLLWDSIIDSVVADNMQKKKDSAKPALLQTECANQYKEIYELPQYHKSIEEGKELMAPIFAAHFKYHEHIRDKQESLMKEYLARDEHWKNHFHAIEEFSNRIDDVKNNWPHEFPKAGPTKAQNEEELLKWTAPDQPQLMTKLRMMTQCYYNMNGLVVDPEAAHNEFKNRISWSEDEKKKFITKYTQHPKKFALIAKALPLKTVKDVIEFYYVNRYTLSLKEKEGAHRKRGGKKKVISEGSNKAAKQ
ncbi:Myb-like DNA-binding domain containing protein [Tritrichomonas foetus]|uniref:Myb-like DNA-binding domain containing protein n=1 Tax=Tritrichomonas foetus TaxID=1144522 RepID=A0A1J4K1D2_9EUKA|nr:Myb-like DNA-binding domain containing protein [Tritrichomonas foetus]|eukprot:OHT05191.1 Myb-like DNA-binding domain containing protein [Tritrichomonas foetus]